MTELFLTEQNESIFIMIKLKDDIISIIHNYNLDFESSIIIID